MNNRIFNTNNALVLFLAAVISVAATMVAVTHARADFGATMSVRVTDIRAVEAELGSCESGFQVRNELDAGSALVPLRNGRATLSSRLDNMIAPAFYCAGERLGYPTSGVELELH